MLIYYGSDLNRLEKETVNFGIFITKFHVFSAQKSRFSIQLYTKYTYLAVSQQFDPLSTIH